MSTHKTASIVFLLLTLVIALLLAGLSTRVATTSAAPVPPPQNEPRQTPNVPPPPIQQAFVPSSTATFAQATAYTSAYVPTTRVQVMASDSTREFDHLTALSPV
jgi:hypothetical protein